MFRTVPDTNYFFLDWVRQTGVMQRITGNISHPVTIWHFKTETSSTLRRQKMSKNARKIYHNRTVTIGIVEQVEDIIVDAFKREIITVIKHKVWERYL